MTGVQTCALPILETDATVIVEKAVASIRDRHDETSESSQLDDAFEQILSRLESSEDPRAGIVELILTVPFTGKEKPLLDLASAYLNLVETIQREDLTMAVLEAAVDRSFTDVSSWLSHLDPTVVSELPDRDRVTATFDHICERLWNQRGQPQADGDQFSEALAQVARLQPPDASKNRSQLLEAIKKQMPQPPHPNYLPQYDQLWSLARDFVDAGLLEAKDLAAIVVGSLNPILAQPLDPQGADMTENWIKWSSGTLDTSAATTLIDALAKSPGIQTPVKEHLQALVATRAVPNTPFPVDAANIRQIVTVPTHRNDPHTAELVGLWLTSPGCDIEQAAEILGNFTSAGQYPSALAAGVKRFSESATAEQRLVLIRKEVAAIDGRDANVNYLLDLRFVELDGKTKAETLLDAYRQFGTKNMRRERILALWSYAKVTSIRQLGPLLDEILLPTVQDGGKEGLRIVKKHFSLWKSPPPGYKNKVKRVLREAAGGKSKDKELERLLRQMS